MRSELEHIFRPPTWPGSVPRSIRRRSLGVDYDTAWARTMPARFARALLVDNVTRPLAYLIARPSTVGLEHLDAIAGPVIFAGNHTSHLDTAVVLSCLPVRYRHHAVVAAAADRFFDRQWKAASWALALGTIPVERAKVNRKSADLAADLIKDGWSLVIFPEGGRSIDGWGQEFRGGAAYLSRRCAVPVVPIHLHGMRSILGKGSSSPRPGKVTVRFGQPLYPAIRDANERSEDARRFALRIEAAVAELADESESDWWQARRRAAYDLTPSLRGPDASSWRRSWALPETARLHRSKDTDDIAEPW